MMVCAIFNIVHLSSAFNFVTSGSFGSGRATDADADAPDIITSTMSFDGYGSNNHPPLLRPLAYASSIHPDIHPHHTRAFAITLLAATPQQPRWPGAAASPYHRLGRGRAHGQHDFDGLRHLQEVRLGARRPLQGHLLRGPFVTVLRVHDLYSRGTPSPRTATAADATAAAIAIATATATATAAAATAAAIVPRARNGDLHWLIAGHVPCHPTAAATAAV